jgi:hypothetical protein
MVSETIESPKYLERIQRIAKIKETRKIKSDFAGLLEVLAFIFTRMEEGNPLNFDELLEELE